MGLFGPFCGILLGGAFGKIPVDLQGKKVMIVTTLYIL